MRGKAHLLALGGSIVFSLASGGPVLAVTPVQASVAIVGDAHGFRPVSAYMSRPGTVVSTFQGPLGTVRVASAPGSTISFEVTPPDPHGRGSIRVGIDPSASRPGGAGQAQNLADLGVAQPASTTPTPAGGTPWASTCININVLGGGVQGSGCSNIYKKHVNGLDWYLSNEYWASASLTSWQGPLGLHLQGVAFETTWHPGNTIYSVAPTTTQSFGACTPWTVTATGTNNGITIGGSVSGQICPSTLGPWNLRLASTYPTSGALWTGNVQGVANYQGSEGVQLVHSPPAVEANWADYYLINYCTGICF